MKKLIRSSLPAFFLAAALALPGAANAGETFYILVNSTNDAKAEGDAGLALMRRLYLKQQMAWPDGEPSLFFARTDGSQEEMAFRAVVLSMSNSELSAHWIRMKQMRGLAPPRAVDSTRILIRQLQSRPEAIGVVSEADYLKHAKSNPGVKTIGAFMSGKAERAAR